MFNPRYGPWIALVTAVVLFAGGIAFLIYIDRADRAEKIDQASVQAGILASTVTAALSFDDPDSAQEYVAAMAADPEIRAVGIYRLNGALFAQFRRTSTDQLPSTLVPKGHSIRNDRIGTAAPILRGGKLIGRVYVERLLETWPRRIGRYGFIVVLLLLAAISAAILTAAQRALTRAYSESERRAAELDRANNNLKEEMSERAKAEEALREAQKMEVIGKLTGGVAHDFNNLLQVILGNLEIIRRRIGNAANLERPVDAAIRGAERAASLTSSLLAFARRQPLAPRSLNVNEVTTAISELLHRTLSQSVQIETVLSPGLWRIAADPTQLDTALVNLAFNARDAMPDGGKLVISTRNARLGKGQLPDDVPEGDYVLLQVTDTGTGMAKDVIAHAFEPFYTTKDIGKGSGLGLSQVYGFIRQSGGHVSIDSTPGDGTCINLYLPRLIEQETLPHATQRTTDVPRGEAAELVLVVEDEPDVREYVVQMIRELGYSVIAAEDGPSALALLECERGIRLLFTDIGLPGNMNGQQLAEKAILVRPHLPVLYATGYARGAFDYSGQANVIDLLVKPFTREVLGNTLRNAIDRTSRSASG